MMFNMVIAIFVLSLNIFALILLITKRKIVYSLLFLVLMVSVQYTGFLGFWSGGFPFLGLYYLLLLISLIFSIAVIMFSKKED